MPTIESSAIDLHVFCRSTGQPLYLVLHRAPEKRYAGYWRMVAGKIETGETAYAAALRELTEETGLQVMNLFVIDYVHSFYDETRDCIIHAPVFGAEVESMQVILSEEHDNSRWITFEQAMSLLKWPGQREGLRRLHEDIVTNPDRGRAFHTTIHE